MEPKEAATPQSPLRALLSARLAECEKANAGPCTNRDFAIASARTGYPAALRALSVAVAALEKIGAETTEQAMRVSTSERLRQLHMQVEAVAECSKVALSAAARELGAETTATPTPLAAPGEGA